MPFENLGPYAQYINEQIGSIGTLAADFNAYLLDSSSESESAEKNKDDDKLDESLKTIMPEEANENSYITYTLINGNEKEYGPNVPKYRQERNKFYTICLPANTSHEPSTKEKAFISKFTIPPFNICVEDKCEFRIENLDNFTLMIAIAQFLLQSKEKVKSMVDRYGFSKVVESEADKNATPFFRFVVDFWRYVWRSVERDSDEISEFGNEYECKGKYMIGILPLSMLLDALNIYYGESYGVAVYEKREDLEGFDLRGAPFYRDTIICGTYNAGFYSNGQGKLFMHEKVYEMNRLGIDSYFFEKHKPITVMVRSRDNMDA